MTRMTRLLRYSAVLSVFAWVAAAVLVLLPSSAGSAVAADSEAQSQTKTLTRDYFDASGSPVTKTNKVTVHIDRHTDIQANERVHITWSGAHPTGGRTTNPFGAGGMEQEYPVMIMECRGDTDTVTPQTCWTDTSEERTQSSLADPAADDAVWLDDKGNGDADNQRISGLTDAEADAIPDGDCTFGKTLAAHITPFQAADGKISYGCSDNDMPPEAAQTSSTPPNEIEAFTDAHGNGSDDFEVRTATENASLGCSATVQCSIVVVPIEGISCTSPAQQQCNLTGNYQAGQLNDGLGADLTVSPKLWWSPSNWDNRFVFPLQLALPPSVCALSTTAGSPVAFYGSELLSQAALQWTPAYCLNKSRFNWQDNVTSDDAGFQLMQNGGAVAAEVSGRGADDADVGYAPTAVTGWGIAFEIDKPDGTQLMSLKLDARLLAKLLTESYPGSTLGASRPGLANNPYSINLDPEFQELNPGLDVRHFSEAASTLLAISNRSAVMQQVTSYIAADPEAMEWIDGKPDPWGMKVNPAYKGLKLPVTTWPLKDGWYPKESGSACLNDNPAPYLQKIASPLSSLRLISQAMFYYWPNVSTVCQFNSSTGLYELSRVPQQGIGSRFMLGLVDLGDAARYDLPVAALQAEPGHYVGANAAGMAAAVELATPAPTAAIDADKLSTKAKKQAEKQAQAAAGLLPETLDQTAFRSSGSAYPGAMVVYTAAKTTGLDKTTAARVAQFIRVSSTEGQVPGRGNGQLPDGYLPITKTGATARLYAQAQAVASVIAAQKVPQEPAASNPSASGSATASTSASASPSAVASGDTSGAAPPGSGSAPAPAAVGTAAPAAGGSVDTSSAPLVRTAAITSGLGGGLLPLLLIVGLFSGAVALGGRVWLHLKGAR